MSWNENLDRSLHAAAARLTGGLSPTALVGAYMDWATHLASSPGKQGDIAEKAAENLARLAAGAAENALRPAEQNQAFAPLPQDHRFVGPEWRAFPFNLYEQSFLMTEENWRAATTGVAGVSHQHEQLVGFFARQFLDVFAPSNLFLANPELLERTLSTGGANFVQGAMNFVEDWERNARGLKPVGADAFKVGRDVAVTPGKVVFRNRLIELIQYSPTTAKTRPEPILVTPAWIMKYYILDLSPTNSLVKYLVDHGFTVFMISWLNPSETDRDLAMDDYRALGPMAALEAIGKIVPNQKIHAVGYCIGGTLSAIAAAAMAREGDERLKSLTLFAAQTDFTEAGELKLFIDESQLDFLDDLMWEQGYLKSSQMAGAFEMLRSNDLVWSHALHAYLMGEREPMNDLMAWNADTTRMPYRMHAEYLQRLYLDNELAEGRFPAAGRPVALADIKPPIFTVGTESDHVAPWRSVFKIQILTDAEVTFVLTSGGHNAGIVSEPGHPHRHFRILTKAQGERHLDPDAWLAAAAQQEGSWWPRWLAWLEERSGAPQAPPPMGAPQEGLAPLMDAPGSYVLVE